MLLDVENLTVTYGTIPALHDLSLTLNEGEIVTLIGANGAGKTTTLKTISGLLKPRAGEIYFNGNRIDRLPAHTIARLGVIQVPEGRKPFVHLTVKENLLLGAFHRPKTEISETLNRIFNSFPRLQERLHQPAGTLSGGELQMLAIARALMANPRLLMLDEPSMGLSPIMVQEIFYIIKQINQTGTAVLLVEQNAYLALQIAHRAYLLETGRIVLSGPAASLRNDPKVKAAYLGE
jgi:branched-chain amino acid transport system ATP-binding protein